MLTGGWLMTTLALSMIVLILGWIVLKQAIALRHLRPRYDEQFRVVQELLERDWNRLTEEEKAAARERLKTAPQQWTAALGLTEVPQQIDPEKALKKFAEEARFRWW